MPDFTTEDLAVWSDGVWEGARPSRIRGVGTDTRTLRPGELFVALKGEHFDGHTFISEAFARGAAAVMAEPGAEVRGGAVLRVPSTRTALLALAAGYRRTLRARMIGVTGSVGKTTVKELIAEVLSTDAPVARTRGNWNNDIGLPLSLLTTEPSDRYGVFEVGMNHPGEIAVLAGCLQPEWACITAVGPVHLEFFSSVEAIAHEKANLARALPPQGLAFLPADDPWYPVLRAAAPCPVVTIGLNPGADYRGRPTSNGGEAFVVEERASGEQGRCPAPGPGRHMIVNALFAVAVGRRAGLSWAAIVDGLRRFRPLPLRWNRAEEAGVMFINDAYNANPLSLRAALETFAQVGVKGRRWLVLGGMLELGSAERELHRAEGRALAAGPWTGLLAVGPRGAWLAEGAQEAGMPVEQIFRCADTNEAAERLVGLTRPGDAVLLKASRAEHLDAIQRIFAELRTQRAAPPGE